MSIEVVKHGFLTTLQDAGRPGFAHLGIGRSGAFDAPALRIANALAGNPRDACGIEFTLLGPTLQFRRGAWVAVTGAPIAFRIDEIDAPMWAPVRIAAGARVELGAVRSGCRGYLAVRGGFDVEPVLGSRSTDVNSALGPLPRPLRAGDRLAIEMAAEMGSGSFFPILSRTRELALKNEPDPISWSVDARPWFDDEPESPLRLLPGRYLDCLAETSRKPLFSEKFHATQESNRAGVRLDGPKLRWERQPEPVSEGCVPGLLQLPPSGQPIAFGPECPVSGGYPPIGQIAAVDLPRLAQRRPGDTIRFRPCTLEDALDALHKRERALLKLETTIAARLRSEA
ncbi:MAG: biotin-dependent carboxyltransferase family protein [Rhodanobacteraceae bacterium]